MNHQIIFMAFGMDITEYRYKLQRDYKNTIDTAFDEGLVQGLRQKAIETALQAKQIGLPLAMIVQLTGLSEEDINSL